MRAYSQPKSSFLGSRAPLLRRWPRPLTQRRPLQPLAALCSQPALQSSQAPPCSSWRRKPLGAAQGRLPMEPPAAYAAAGSTAACLGSGLVPALAVLVGWMVVAGSCIRSLPQILRILKNKSVEGLSLTSFASEACCYGVQVAYNVANRYPFSTFGDTAMCWLQNVAIIGLIFVHGAVPRATKLFIVLASSAFYAFLFSEWCSPSVLQALQASTVVVLAVFGRLPQILYNIRRGNSGELSMISTGLSLAGNLARVFTTLVMVKDGMILTSASTQALLNGILLWQTIDTARRLKAASQPQPGLQQ